MWYYWLLALVLLTSIVGLFLYKNVKKVTKCSSCPNNKNYGD
jgi:hypothetical protein